MALALRESTSGGRPAEQAAAARLLGLTSEAPDIPSTVCHWLSVSHCGQMSSKGREMRLCLLMAVADEHVG